MRLKEYIKEEVEDPNEIDIFMERVKKDCQPWLRAAKGLKIYRGFRKELPDVIYNKKVRTDRKPKDMSVTTSKSWDELFYKKFGWKARSEGLFVLGGFNYADCYARNRSYEVYPIGEFKFLWNPIIKDLFNYKLEFNLIDGYTDKDLIKAIKSKNCEIMIKCKEYHAIKRGLEND